MIPAFILLTFAAACGILAACSFATLARKRLRIAEQHEQNAHDWQRRAELADARAARAEHERDRLRSMLVYRTDHLSVYDLSDAQLRRLVKAIASHGKPSPYSPATLESLIGPDSSIVEERE